MSGDNRRSWPPGRSTRWIVASLCLVLAIEILLGWTSHRSIRELSDHAVQGPAAQRMPALRRLATRDDGTALTSPVWDSVAESGDLETRTYLLWLGRERDEWKLNLQRVLDSIEPSVQADVALLIPREKRLADLQKLLDARARIREHDRNDSH